MQPAHQARFQLIYMPVQLFPGWLHIDWRDRFGTAQMNEWFLP